MQNSINQGDASIKDAERSGLLVRSPVYQDEYLEIVELFKAIWRARLWIVLCVFITTLTAIAYAFLATPYYKSSVLLQPVSLDDNKAMSALSKNLGGLSSFVNIGNSGDKTPANLATLTSRQFLSGFMQKHDVIKALYPEVGLVANNAGVRSEMKNYLKNPPDIWDAHQKFSKMIIIRHDKKTNLITLDLEWRDPKLAADWLNRLVSEVNRYLREDAIGESQDSIIYLQKMIAETQEVEMREVFYQLLASEIQTMKVATIRTDYAFKVIDSAIQPKHPSKPQKKFIIVIGFILGCFLSLGGVFIRHMLWNTRQASSFQ